MSAAGEKAMYHGYDAVIATATRLLEIWHDDYDQIDAHLVSEGFEPFEIEVAFDVFTMRGDGATEAEIADTISIRRKDELYV